MTRFSVLDLVSVREGDSVSDAMAQAAAFAVHAEQLGFHRYWIAEHHGMEGIAGGATAVVLAHIGAATSTIKIGAGGIMLPNHAPMVIAEQFGTLDALFPGRIDLGLGRAPGSDGRVAQALRRNLNSDDRQFPRDVMELKAFFEGDERLGITATPGAGARPEMWILGSSTFGAQLAAMLGMPFAFASHFAPAMLDDALRIYRSEFRATPDNPKPYAAAAINVFAADDADEAELLASSMQQSFVALRTGTPGKLKPPQAGYRATLPRQAQAMLASVLECTAIGTRADIASGLSAFLERTRVDEVIITGSMYDQTSRLRSLAIAMEAARDVSAIVA